MSTNYHCILVAAFVYGFTTAYLNTTSVFRKLVSPATHPNLLKPYDSTPQNFASQKVGTKLHVSINMYLHINPCPIRMQAYETDT
jgi:hypothetical protein